MLPDIRAQLVAIKACAISHAGALAGAQKQPITEPTDGDIGRSRGLIGQHAGQQRQGQQQRHASIPQTNERASRGSAR